MPRAALKQHAWNYLLNYNILPLQHHILSMQLLIGPIFKLFVYDYYSGLYRVCKEKTGRQEQASFCSYGYS